MPVYPFHLKLGDTMCYAHNVLALTTRCTVNGRVYASTYLLTYLLTEMMMLEVLWHL